MDYWSDTWRSTRAKVIARSGGICERCKADFGAHVHHIRYNYPRRGNEPLEWLIHLCLKCHGEEHGGRVFHSTAEQGERAAKNRKRRKWTHEKQASCAWCGGTYSRKKHREICVKNGVHIRRD